jgi:hypothetical protein
MPHSPFLPGQIVPASALQALDTQGTYDPVLTATTTNPNLGADGESSGAWQRSGHLITGWAQFFFSGTGVSAGSGNYQISLPFTADVSFLNPSTTVGAASVIGNGVCRAGTDPTGNSRQVQVVLSSAGLVRMNQLDGVGGQVTHNSPFTWNANSRISIIFSYLADPAGLP